MTLFARAGGCAALLLLAGCSTAGVVPTATSNSIADLSQYASTNGLVSVSETSPAGGKALGPVEVYACQAHSFDPPPTDDLALAMLKAEAAKRGARVLVGVQLQRQNIDMARNCYWTIHATAEAYS